MLSNANLVVLIEGDAEARTYFLSLPEYVRNHLSEKPEGIGTLDELRTRASQLLNGNG